MTAPLQALREQMCLFEVEEALTSATGTPSGGRQCSTIMPFRDTSVPWGSCSKFFLRSRGREQTARIKNIHCAQKRRHEKAPKDAHKHRFACVSCATVSTRTYRNAVSSVHSGRITDKVIGLVWEWHGGAYRQSGQLPCGSWRCPDDSRPHTDTSNPLGHESPPPADVTHWSSPHGSSALQTNTAGDDRLD